MGCGTSAQPAEDTQQQQTLAEGSKDTATADQVEPFNNTSKTPSPKSKTKQKETIADGPVPEPAAYVPVVESDDNIDALSSIGTPFGGSPHSSQDMQEDNIRAPGLSPTPGYKMENETRKIGGFDPEAFRKANAINNGGANQSGTAADSWAQPVPSNNSYQQPQQYGTGGYSTGGNGGGFQTQNGGDFGGGGGGYGNGNAGGDRWGSSGQGDYIQSDDIFSTQSPQAMQNSSSMNFRDDSLSNDPFRSPGGMGHNPAQVEKKLITHEDDALMDDILGELDEL